MRAQRALAILGAAALAVVAVGFYVALPARGPGDLQPTSVPNAMSTPPAETASPTPAALEPRTVASAEIPLGGMPIQLRATDEALYAALGSRILRIDPVTEVVTTVLNVPSEETQCSMCGGIHVGWAFDIGDGSAWVAYHGEGQSFVRRFDLDTGELQAEITVGKRAGRGAGTSDVIVAFGSVWTVQCHSGSVVRIDPTTNQEVGLIQMLQGFGGGGTGHCVMPYSIAAGNDSLWVGIGNEADLPDWPRTAVVRIDPDNEELAFTVAPSARAISCGRFAVDADAVWVSSCPESGARTVVRVDAIEEVAAEPIAIEGFAGDPVIVDGRVWVPVVPRIPGSDASLVAFDAETGEMTDAIQLGSGLRFRAKTAAPAIVAFGSLWVHGENDTLLRIRLSELAS